MKQELIKLVEYDLMSSDEVSFDYLGKGFKCFLSPRDLFGNKPIRAVVSAGTYWNDGQQEHLTEAWLNAEDIWEGLKDCDKQEEIKRYLIDHQEQIEEHE